MESDGKVITMCVTCNLNQHLVCPFCLQNGSVHFVYKMEVSILFTKWKCPFCLQNGSVHFVYKMEVSILFTKWKCPFCLQNGSVHFVYKMEEMDKKWVMVP